MSMQDTDDEEFSDELTTTVDLSEDSDSDDSDTESLASSVAELSSGELSIRVRVRWPRGAWLIQLSDHGCCTPHAAFIFETYMYSVT